MYSSFSLLATPLLLDEENKLKKTHDSIAKTEYLSNLKIFYHYTSTRTWRTLKLTDWTDWTIKIIRKSSVKLVAAP